MLESPKDRMMPDEKPSQPAARVWTLILRDIHFWIPVIVLLAGLIVLHWIQ